MLTIPRQDVDKHRAFTGTTACVGCTIILLASGLWERVECVSSRMIAVGRSTEISEPEVSRRGVKEF